MKSQNVFQQNLVTFPLPSLLMFFTLELLLCQSGCCLLTDSLVFSVCHWTLNQCRSIGVVGVSVDCCRTQPVQESCSDITLRLNWTNFFQIVYTIFSWKKALMLIFPINYGWVDLIFLWSRRVELYWYSTCLNVKGFRRFIGLCALYNRVWYFIII